MTTELRDIHGLDVIPWYPIAWGWWLLLLAAIILGLIIFQYWRYKNRLKLKHKWRQIALAEWQNLNAPILSDYERATKLSHLLRWVAIQNYGRTCAGLTGEAWLAWLTEHDPRQFAWLEHGKILTQLPYMPPDSNQPCAQNLTNLQRAAYYFILETNK
jgi:hypothetical protein